MKDREKINVPVDDSYIEKQKQAVEISRVIGNMCNTYSLDSKGISEQVLLDKNMEQKFIILALQWIEGMANNYSNNYVDLRDKASKEMCHKLLNYTQEFELLHKKYCKQGYKECDGKNKTMSALIIEQSMWNMHPTLRNTFSGLALTILFKSSIGEKLFLEAAKRKIVEHKEVRFFMI